MIEIDRNLLDWIIAFDEGNQIHAKTYGNFSVSRMDVEIFLSDKDIEKFNIAEKFLLNNKGTIPPEEVNRDYYRYIQAHNHELFHYYQALTLPAFQIYQRLTRSKLKYEAATMLRFFEERNNYILGEHHDILEALKQSNFNISSDIAHNFNELMLKYKFYIQHWKSQYKGVSLFYIIEGMAHIFSIQSTDTAKNYLPELENTTEYNIAYNTFNTYLDNQFKHSDIRLKHLTFLYICHFSCQIYDHIEDEILEKPSRLFHVLCSRLNLYFKTYYKLLVRYENYSETELRQLNQFDINDENLSFANKEQISQIYAFFELLPSIQKDAEKYYRQKLIDPLKIKKEVLQSFDGLNIDLKNYFQLVNFSIFPSLWADVWEAYDKIQKTKVGENKFEFSDESAFYEFIENCKKILNKKDFFLPCCKVHGNLKNKRRVLHCPNEGGLAYYLKQMTGRSAFELFKEVD